jgi:hypothetical protein
MAGQWVQADRHPPLRYAGLKCRVAGVEVAGRVSGTEAVVG